MVNYLELLHFGSIVQILGIEPVTFWLIVRHADMLADELVIVNIKSSNFNI